MRTRSTLTSILASVSLLAIGWQFGSAAVAIANGTTSKTTPGPTGKTGTTGTTGSTGSTGSTDPSSGGTTNTGTGAADGTFTGDSVNTRFGSVQVQITVAGGKITEVAPLHLTDADGRSVQISNYAAPMLREEVLASQSAQVQNIGGATYTTQGYLGSLQSALDQAGL